MASVVGSTVWRGGILGAEGALDALGGAATATDPAVRVALLPPDPGALVLPVESGDGLIVLDNFGGFSQSLGSCSHNGIDVFPTTTSTRTLVACVDGVLEGQRFAGSSGAQGNAWILQDEQGISYRYHHIGEFLDGLAVGAFVERGQPIATMGKTGHARSEHLHFEVRLDGSSGTAVDPLPLLTVPTTSLVEVRDLGDADGCSGDAD